MKFCEDVDDLKDNSMNNFGANNKPAQKDSSHDQPEMSDLLSTLFVSKKFQVRK